MEELQKLAEEDLWSMLTDTTGRDRMDVLFELGRRASQREDYDRATTLWQEVEAVARELDDVARAAEAVRLQGGAAFYNGDYEAAASLYERAAQGHIEAGLNREAAGAMWCLADCHRALGQAEEQLVAATRSRELAQIEQALTLSGDACYLQARALYSLNRDEEALHSWRAGRDHYRAAERADQVAVIDDFALTVHLYLGNLDEALELARGCLVLARTSASDSDDSYARYRLAEVLWRRGQTDDALHQVEQAMAGYRAHDNLAGAARCEQLRAEAYFDQEQPGTALASFADARVLFDATGRDFDALRCETRRSIVLHYVGDYQAAARINERLVQEYSRLPDQEDAVRWSIVRWLDNLREEDRFDLCLEVAEAHMTLWPDDAGSDDASHREFLGLYALALENTGRVEQATAIATHVIAQTPAREASIGTAFCYEIRGRSRLAGDEGAAGQDLSHAIALHLAKGNADRARRLSSYFLPAAAEARSRGSEADAPRAGATGHG